MSNPERDPEEILCRSTEATAVDVMTPRDVPLGGPRAMTVRRTLPTRGRTLIGAWCFLDHYGPDDVAETGGMVLPPHPHIGLQTVSWLFNGELEHRDSAGHHATVRPGELNLMTAGHGISHSEVSTFRTTTLHGAQLWVALPEPARDGESGFEHYAPPAVTGEGWTARVFMGSLLGSTSPVTTHTPLLGAEIVLDAGAEVGIDLEAAYEIGILVDEGSVEVSGPDRLDQQDVTVAAPVEAHELAYLPPGRDSITVTGGADGARLLLLGGPPFGEPIVMWWNFVGRTHEEVVAAREDWQSQITSSGYVDGRFGIPAGDVRDPIPAPDLPHVRLKERT